MTPLHDFRTWRAVLNLAVRRRIQVVTSWALLPFAWLFLGRLVYLLASRSWVCPPFIRTWALLLLGPLIALLVVMTFWPRHLRYHWGARALLILTMALAVVPPMVRFWPLFQDKLIRVLPFLAIGAPLAWFAHRRSPEHVLACRSVADEDRLLKVMRERLTALRNDREPTLELGVRKWGSEAWRTWKAYLGPDYLLLAAADNQDWVLVEKAKARLELPRNSSPDSSGASSRAWIEGLRLRFIGQGPSPSLRAPLQSNPVVGRLSSEDLARFQAWRDAEPKRV